MSWTKNQILLNQTANTSCKDIFQAVCDELGEHYQNSGIKYSKSRPKLTYKDKELKVEICFWSKRSNTPGSHVSFEIVPSFYSLQVKKELDSINPEKKSKGLIIGLMSIFKFKHNNSDQQEKVQQIYGEVINLERKTYGDDVIRYNHNCNVYGIDELNFKKIAEFIDSKIIYWIEKLKTPEGILEYLEDRPIGVYKILLGQNNNTSFISYCNLKFPELNIEERLKEKTNTQQGLY